MTAKPSILELMKQRPVIGDGSYVVTLERRGYVKAGSWTPEAVIEHPDGVRQLHKEFLRAGADVLQSFTYNSSESRLTTKHAQYSSEEVNQAACVIVKEVAGPDTYICGGISYTPAYRAKAGKQVVQDQFRKQCEIFRKNKVDMVLGEFFRDAEEAEWAIEVMKELGVPVALTMVLGPNGDLVDVSPQDCAVRLAKAGADIIGLNCQYDPNTCFKTLKMMKEGLAKEKLHPFLMLQPLGYHCPEAEDTKDGYHELPEYPYCLEPRLLTRFDCRRYARQAYELGVRYIGGCCGFEPYHMREIAEELAPEIGRRPPGQDKSGCFGEAMVLSNYEFSRKRIGRDYWMNVVPATGRPNNPSASVPATKETK